MSERTDGLVEAAYRREYGLREELRKVRALLTDLVVAAGRMRDDWAEGDDAVKQSLWRALHEAA